MNKVHGFVLVFNKFVQYFTKRTYIRKGSVYKREYNGIFSKNREGLKRGKKKKRCNYSAFSSKFFSTFTSTSFEKNQPPTAIPINTIQNVSFHGVDSGNECGMTPKAGCASV